ncbi:hypothetical protein ES703_48257 [subsurface metagenome]
MRTVQFCSERQLPGFVAAQANNNHLVRETGEDFAGESCLADAVANCCQPGVDVQLPAIIDRLVMGRKVQMQIAERLIFFLPKRHTHHLFHRQLFSLALFALKQQLADGGQILDRSVVLIFVWLASPQRIIIELQLFVLCAAEDHSSKTSVSDR